MSKLIASKTFTFLIVCFILVILTALICCIMDFDGLYGQDGYAYLYQINHMDSLLEQDAFCPPFYAFIGWILQCLVQKPILSLQWVSVLSWMGTFILLHRIASKNYKIQSSLFQILLIISFLCSPFVLRMSVLVMSDTLAIFIALLTIYFGCFQNSNTLFLYFLLLQHRLL